MTRETLGLTAYRLVFDDGSVCELASVALIDILMRCNGHRPRHVYVIDGNVKAIDEESIAFLWDKIHGNTIALRGR